MTPSDLAAQFDLYVEGHERDASEWEAKVQVSSSKRDSSSLIACAYQIAKRDEARASVHQLRLAADMVREFLVPRWTKEPPVKPGAYWYMGPPVSGRATKPLLVTVWRFDGDTTLYAGTGGATGDPSTVEQFTSRGASWCGPFLPPQPGEPQ